MRKRKSVFEWSSGIIATKADILEIFENLEVSPSPTPLIQARLELSYAPARIKGCLVETLKGDCELMTNVQTKMRTTNVDEVYSRLLQPITHAWAPGDRGSREYTTEEADTNPEVVPDAIVKFRNEMNRFRAPISDMMELALAEAHRNAMIVMREDLNLLERVVQMYNNNPNFRHEVGRVVAIREVARGGDIYAGRDIYDYSVRQIAARRVV